MRDEENNKKSKRKIIISKNTSNKLPVAFYNPLIVHKYLKFDREEIYYN